MQREFKKILNTLYILPFLKIGYCHMHIITPSFGGTGGDLIYSVTLKILSRILIYMSEILHSKCKQYGSHTEALNMSCPCTEMCA